MKEAVRTLALSMKPLAWLALIAFFCLSPAEDLPGTGLFAFPFADSVGHFAMYFIMALLLARPLKAHRLPLWATALGVTFLAGGIMELLQLFLTSSRSASVLDILANLAGGAVGVAAFKSVVEGTSWERWL